MYMYETENNQLYIYQVSPIQIPVQIRTNKILLLLTIQKSVKMREIHQQNEALFRRQHHITQMTDT